MIDFYKFVPQFGMRDASPFVLKLETYMRLAGVEYKTTETMDPTKAPKKKLPYIRDGDKTIADSSFCITYLKEKYCDPLGENLSAEQHAIGHAVKTMLEERTYWVMVNHRWMDADNQIIIKDAWFGMIPAFIRGLIFGKIVKDMKKGMFTHGIGRHTDAEIFTLGLADFKAFEDILGQALPTRRHSIRIRRHRLRLPSQLHGQTFPERNVGIHRKLQNPKRLYCTGGEESIWVIIPPP